MSVRFKYYLRGCGLGILVASLVFIVSLHAHGGAMSDEKAMQRASELGMIMPDDTQTQEAETQTTELPVKETNLPDTQRTTQAVTQKVPQNDTQKQTERDTSSEQNDTSKESEKKAEEKKKTQDSQKKEEEKEKRRRPRRKKQKGKSLHYNKRRRSVQGDCTGSAGERTCQGCGRFPQIYAGSQLCKIYPCGDIYAGKGNEL